MNSSVERSQRFALPDAVEEGSVDGCYRYALELIDGEPADPPAFMTVLDDWRTGDEFLASNLQKFRIRAIGTLDAQGTEQLFQAVWIVEPVT